MHKTHIKKAEKFQDILMEKLNEFLPEKIVKFTSEDQVWITPEIKEISRRWNCKYTVLNVKSLDQNASKHLM